MVYGTVGQSNVKLHIPRQDESHKFIQQDKVLESTSFQKGIIIIIVNKNYPQAKLEQRLF